MRNSTFLVLLAVSAAFAASPVIKVACVGDSITYGSGIEDRAANSYPALLGALLGEGFEVGNFGVPGARVSAISRKPYSKQPEYLAAVEYKPRIVVIALGINDTSINEWRQNAERFVSDYKELIHAFSSLETKPEIFLTTLMPVFPPYRNYLQIQPNIKEAWALINETAASLGLAVIDLYQPLNSEPAIYVRDGIHPSRQGAEIIAETVYRAITGNHGGLKVAGVFGDNMLLQRNAPLRVWGIANTGKKVTVDFDGEIKTAVADVNGRWAIELPERKAGLNLVMTVGCEDKSVRFNNIAIGDVWLCSGQSNMQWQFRQDGDYAIEKKDADYPNLRLLNLEGSVGTANKPYTKEQIGSLNTDDFFTGKWCVSSESMSGDISAIAFYFGRVIHTETDVPVGIIECAVGGSTMESWMPREAFDDEALAKLLDNWLFSDAGTDWPKERAKVNLSAWINQPQGPMPHHPYQPCFLYNAAIRPLSNLAVRGVLWYQGESNATQADATQSRDVVENAKLFHNLIESWRSTFNMPQMPFYYVQLPCLERNWMEFRQMQLDTLKGVSNTAMAVAIDLGDSKDVHPKHKRQLASRLAMLAMVNIYGKQNAAASGPLPKSAYIQGQSVVVEFDYAGQGLKSSDGMPLRTFEIQTNEGIWVSCEAKIQGNTVVVDCGSAAACALRYGWSPVPQCNLVNSGNIAASPFRLDIKK